MGMTKDVFDEYGNYKYPDYSNSQYTNYATATGGKMGMTIADNIDFLNDAKKLFEDIANNPSINETVKIHFTIESLESAIDILRKYQKIEQVLSDYINDDSVGMSDYWMGRIKEVVEDGND